MSSVATPPTAPNALRAHVVSPGDQYHKRGDRCAKCHRAAIPCDVITTSQHNPAIVHVGCMTNRQRDELYASLATDPAASLNPCWFTDSRTLSPCPLAAYNHNLCRDHHAQLCCAKKPTPQR